MFWDASAFDQMEHHFRDNMSAMFLNANALSNTNKGEIHKSFSSNPNWPYDWSEFVVYEPITDANFQDAVNLWFSDEANATYTYGHQRRNVSHGYEYVSGLQDRTNFDANITGWDVSNVTSMNHMFVNATSFNQPIGDWNVSEVTNMDAMFHGASCFNQ